MKTKEELSALKNEAEALNRKLAELSEDELEQVSGGDIVPDNGLDTVKLNDGICIHCGGQLMKLLDIQIPNLGSDTSFLCTSCFCQYVHHVTLQQRADYWMDNGVLSAE